MTNRVAAAIALTLVTAACSTQSHGVQGQSAVPDSAAPTSSATTAPHDSAPVSPAQPIPTDSTAPGSSPSTSAEPSTAPTESPTSAPAGRQQAGLTPAGTYQYRLRGSQSSPFGSESLDDTPTLTVDAPRNQQQHSLLTGKHARTDQTVSADLIGLRLVDLRLSQEGVKAEFHPATPVLLAPAAPRKGQHWQWRITSTDGKYSLHATLRITDTSHRVTVHGRRVHTVSVASVLVITGSNISVTIHQADEGASDGLIVREHAVGDGTFDGVKFHTDSTRTLTSAPR